MKKILDYNEFVKEGSHQDRGGLPTGKTELFFYSSKKEFALFAILK